MHTTTAIINHSKRLARCAAAGAGALVVLLASASPALADPPGSNGTIKVDGVDFDAHPNNEPHVGCVFQVDFYGFDEGDLYASVTFEAQAPTAGGVLLTDTVFIGEDDSSGGGSEAGLDAQATYDLSSALAGIEPHPVQGHHVKLTIEAEGTQGDPRKHKVFWVEGCLPPVEEPPAEEPPAEEPPVEEPPAPEVLPAPPVTPAAPPVEVLGAVTPADTLPRTGSSTTLLAALGAALVTSGAGARRLGLRLGGR